MNIGKGAICFLTALGFMPVAYASDWDLQCMNTAHGMNHELSLKTKNGDVVAFDYLSVNPTNAQDCRISAKMPDVVLEGKSISKHTQSSWTSDEHGVTVDSSITLKNGTKSELGKVLLERGSGWYKITIVPVEGVNLCAPDAEIAPVAILKVGDKMCQLIFVPEENEGRTR